MKAGCHLTGAMYMKCLMLPRVTHELPKETILVMVIPGTHEPTMEQINNNMEIGVQHMLYLGNGMYAGIMAWSAFSHIYPGHVFNVYGSNQLSFLVFFEVETSSLSDSSTEAKDTWADN